MSKVKYKRVLLKLSGESLCKQGGFGIDGEQTLSIAQRIAKICEMDVQISIVVGGGNFLRGATFAANSYIPRASADYMGMLATVMNATALSEAIKAQGQPSEVFSAIEVPAITEKFIRRNVNKWLEMGTVAMLAGGTGNPFFSTDTCAALRASEIDADVIIKATKVDGVYTDDPVKNPDAKLIEELSFQDVLNQDLKIMDHSAISLCRENNIPIKVLNIFKENNITRAICGENVGTIITNPSME